MKIAVAYSRVRFEEKLLFAALEARGVPYDPVDVREVAYDLSERRFDGYDIVLLRCLSDTRAFYLSRWLAGQGVPTVNPHRVIAVCGDKLLTSLALEEAGLPTPRTAFGFTPERMVEAIEELGYPAVLKPLRGSWGRLLARVSDRHAAEALLEHKRTLGGVSHSVFYAQQYIEKPGGRDVRTMVVGDAAVYAVWRSSEHWITNTATGGSTARCAMTDEIRELSLGAARAVGGEVVAVDLLQDGNGRWLVNEVNHTPEFHGAARVAEVDIAGRIVDYAIERAQEAA